MKILSTKVKPKLYHFSGGWRSPALRGKFRFGRGHPNHPENKQKNIDGSEKPAKLTE